MNMAGNCLRPLSVAALLCVAGTPILAGDEGDHERETVTRTLGDDRFSAGDDVALAGEIAGDAIAAGGEVTLDATVKGDSVLAGGRVFVRGSSQDDLYAAGGEVRISGHVTGNARIAGGQVEIERNGTVDGGVTMAGGRVRVDGRVGRYLQMAGGTLRLDGHVAGNVEAAGGELIVGPQAVVEGALTFRGPKPPRVAAGANIRDGVKHVPDRKFSKRNLKAARGALVGLALFWMFGWFIVGAILMAVWPGFSGTVIDNATRRTGRSLLLGLAVLFLMPILIVMVAVTVVGIPLALLLIGLYFVLLPLGYVASAAAIGEWLLGRLRRGAAIAGGGSAIRTSHRVWMLLGVLVALFLLTRIPVLGAILCLLLVLAGMGSLLLAAANRHRGAPAPA